MGNGAGLMRLQKHLGTTCLATMSQIVMTWQLQNQSKVTKPVQSINVLERVQLELDIPTPQKNQRKSSFLTKRAAKNSKSQHSSDRTRSESDYCQKSQKNYALRTQT